MHFSECLAVASVMLTATACSAVRAADLTGTWTSRTKTPRGVIERPFMFKQQGEKLVGHIVSPHGDKEEIKEGKVIGDQLEFTVVRRQPGGATSPITYKGKLAGDEIKGSFVGPAGHAIEWIAKRAKARGGRPAVRAYLLLAASRTVTMRFPGVCSSL